MLCITLYFLFQHLHSSRRHFPADLQAIEIHAVCRRPADVIEIVPAFFVKATIEFAVGQRAHQLAFNNE